jgi:endoglucanase
MIRHVMRVVVGCVVLATLSACNETPLETTLGAQAVSGGGVSFDVVTTQTWQGGFNGAVRIVNTAFPAPITSFQVVFKLSGNATVTGTPWNGSISAPDAAGNRTATQPGWLGSSPIRIGQTWDVGFNGNGVFSGSTIVSAKINGQTINLGGGGGNNDTTPPTVTLSSSNTNVTTASSITLTANATDNVGVSKVEFYNGSSLLGTDTAAPYTQSVSLTSAQNGTRSYTAKAFYAAGNTRTSSAVNVTVNIGTSGGTGWTTSAGKLLKDGVEVRLFGLNWFGLETSDRVLHGLWSGRSLTEFLVDIKSKGFNALRIPLSPQSINAGFPIAFIPPNDPDKTALSGKDGRAMLEYTLMRARENNVYVLLDFHTCNPSQIGGSLPGSPISCSGYSLSSWLADLRTLATLAKSYSNVVGVDLNNEPHGLTWTQWADLASQGGQAVLQTNPNITVWVEGVGNASSAGGFGANWGGNLYEAGNITGIPNNRLVYSPHVYGPSVSVASYFSDPTYPNNMPGIWNSHFGHLFGKGYTVIPGEFGGKYTTNAQKSLDDKLWQDSFVTYLLSKGTRSFFYWSLNPNSGDTGGIYLDDWKTFDTAKLALLQRLMQ